MNTRILLAALCLGAMPLAANAGEEPTQAVGADFFASSDADRADVLKVGLTYNFQFADLEHYTGVRLESFTFSAPGTHKSEARGYVSFAGTGERWKWNGVAGTDGHDLLGSASLYVDEAFRQEYFVSRDLVETALGVRKRLYATYLGAAYDIPLGERDAFTTLVAVQKFTGDNWRLHMRGTYIHVLEPDWGLSAQLRVRSFWNSAPREYDYFSPRWYAEAIPTLQIRRFYRHWQFRVAAGWGARRNTGGGWKSAGLVNATAESPTFGSGWYLRGDVAYSNMPVSAGYSYNYEQFSLTLIRKL